MYNLTQFDIVTHQNAAKLLCICIQSIVNTHPAVFNSQQTKASTFKGTFYPWKLKGCHFGPLLVTLLNMSYTGQLQRWFLGTYETGFQISNCRKNKGTCTSWHDSHCKNVDSILHPNLGSTVEPTLNRVPFTTITPGQTNFTSCKVWTSDHNRPSKYFPLLH